MKKVKLTDDNPVERETKRNTTRQRFVEAKGKPREGKKHQREGINDERRVYSRGCRFVVG